MAVNLKVLSPSQLQALIDRAQAQMSDARQTQIREARAKIDSILDKAGLTLDEVYASRSGKKGRTGQGAKSRKGSKVAPKYRNPADPDQTWTGRGRQPGWVVAALKKRGVTMDSLLIDGGKGTPKKGTKMVTKRVAKNGGRKKGQASGRRRM